MQIIVLDYSNSTTTIIDNVPDEWEEEQIEEFLNNNFRMSDCYYMSGQSVDVDWKDYAKFE